MALADFLPAAGGGLLIGAAASGLLLLNGRIAGVSGILRGFLAEHGTAFRERVLFLLGLIAGSALYALFSGQYPVPRSAFPAWLLALSGLLVGLGTGLAKGCTSGHGVCGLARLSRRSFGAVGIFLGTAVLTTYLVRHWWGIY
ncbi:YeeE/YedE family protein [Quatrionicoccus australiensis]|uniref:YeeE/YedE family protein n=1 Tax=Quatrionicoccus australiensis TaxID=138118 RepID=UPI001CFC3C03|nr:YeeE/YedE thiosulfate transporter family protein [Quatrionicoccus australiensis]